MAKMAPCGGFGVPPTPPAAPPGLTPVPVAGLLPLPTPVTPPEAPPAAPALVGSPPTPPGPPPVPPVPSLSPSGPPSPSPSPGVSPLGTPADRVQTPDCYFSTELKLEPTTKAITAKTITSNPPLQKRSLASIFYSLFGSQLVPTKWSLGCTEKHQQVW